LTTTGLTNALQRARKSEDSLKESNLALQNNLEELANREKALRESEERFRLLAENVVDNIWILNPTDLSFIYVSPSVEKIIGYTPEEMLGLSLDQLLTPESGLITSQAIAKDFEEAKKDSSRTRRLELELYHKNGSTVWVETTARVVYINWLSSYGIIGVTRDISERKEAEVERRLLQNQLLQAQKMEAIGTLAGGIAHDFNNSLQGILGYSQILISEKDEGDPDLQKFVQIEKAAKRASELTKQLLMFSRKVESQLRPLDLNQEIRQSENLLERTIPKMIAIETRLGDNLKIINGDPVQIEQMIMNLCINARDAMVDGGRMVIESRDTFLDKNYCKMHVDAVPGEYIMLSVSDNGSGMDKKTREHIFEPFFTTKETGKGTGLGLAMVYGIVKNHGGHITCSSEPGEGTTFKIYFPVIAEIHLNRLEREADTANIPRGNETILLVDDEDYLRELGEQMLSRFGYTVLTAPDGETALQIYQEKDRHISLVIMDLIMPGMGGKNGLKAILKEDPAAKIIIASGYSIDGPTKEIFDSTAKGYISKPFELNQMLGLVRRVLDMH
jgi:PAS domain S-box-containing protein